MNILNLNGGMCPPYDPPMGLVLRGLRFVNQTLYAVLIQGKNR